jgi:hypothetical protein
MLVIVHDDGRRHLVDTQVCLFAGGDCERASHGPDGVTIADRDGDLDLGWSFQAMAGARA